MQVWSLFEVSRREKMLLSQSVFAKCMGEKLSSYSQATTSACSHCLFVCLLFIYSWFVSHSMNRNAFNSYSN